MLLPSHLSADGMAKMYPSADRFPWPGLFSVIYSLGNTAFSSNRNESIELIRIGRREVEARPCCWEVMPEPVDRQIFVRSAVINRGPVDAV